MIAGPPTGTDEVDLRPYLVRGVLGLGALFVAVVGLATLFRDPLYRFSSWFVDGAGPLGVALGYGAADLLILPVPSDLFLLFGYVAGLPPVLIVVAASSGSLVAGAIAYALGGRISRMADRVPGLRSVARSHREEARRLFDRFGTGALLVGIFTPFPYTITAAAAGGLGMPVGRFATLSLLRVVKVSVYLGLIRAGVDLGL